MKESDLVAAIDLGSNSFHMIVARMERGQLHIVDRMRERVRLGSGLDDRHRISAVAQARALACLERFGERVRDMPAGRVRAVGTNTLRKAKNGASFLERAHRALGHPIEVIAGREEARLIYLGVIQTMPKNVVQRLVVDIGGGSTECVIGERHEIVEADSLYMGCVSFSERFFPDGAITPERFEAARIAAKLELASIGRRYRALGWQIACGCSGTVHAAKKIARQNGWSAGEITPRALKKLERALLDGGHIDRLAIPGLADDRRAVIPGGVAILSAIVETFELAELVPAPGALREGALYDLVGRIRDEDVRDRTIRWFCQRYGVDLEQSARVERTALTLLHQLVHAWRLDLEHARRVLSWASHLFEIGLSLSHTGYHKHSAYVVAHADMAGFSRDDQAILAAVIQGHRRKVKPETYRDLPPEYEHDVLYYTLIFRLAVLLNRNRSDEPTPVLGIDATLDRLALTFPPGWLEAHPLSMEDLVQQVERFKRVGMELVLGEVPVPTSGPAEPAVEPKKKKDKDKDKKDKKSKKAKKPKS